MTEIKSIGFIGFGLIGGSIARLLRAGDASLDIFAYDYHMDAPAPGLCLAREEGTLSRITNELTAFSGADLIFLCAPVSRNIEYLAKLKDIVPEHCILTDVGSVKGNIAAAKVEELRFDLNPVEKVEKGQLFSMPVPAKVRPSDRLYLWAETGKE